MVCFPIYKLVHLGRKFCKEAVSSDIEPPENLGHCSQQGNGCHAKGQMSREWGRLCVVGHSFSIASERIYLACKLLLGSEGCMSFRAWAGRKLEAHILLRWVGPPGIPPCITGGLSLEGFPLMTSFLRDLNTRPTPFFRANGTFLARLHLWSMCFILSPISSPPLVSCCVLVHHL